VWQPEFFLRREMSHLFNGEGRNTDQPHLNSISNMLADRLEPGPLMKLSRADILLQPHLLPNCYSPSH